MLLEPLLPINSYQTYGTFNTIGAPAQVQDAPQAQSTDYGPASILNLSPEALALLNGEIIS